MAKLYKHVPSGTICRMYAVHDRVTGKYTEMKVEYTKGHFKKGTTHKITSVGPFALDKFEPIVE